MSLFHLNIVTPDRQFFSNDINKVVVNGVEGELAVLKGRAPLITPLKMGIIKIYMDDKVLVASLEDGYISVDEDYTIIVTKKAEWPYEIDLEDVIKDKEEAEEQIARDYNVTQAKIALIRALNRIKVLEHKDEHFH